MQSGLFARLDLRIFWLETLTLAALGQSPPFLRCSISLARNRSYVDKFFKLTRSFIVNSSQCRVCISLLFWS